MKKFKEYLKLKELDTSRLAGMGQHDDMPSDMGGVNYNPDTSGERHSDDYDSALEKRVKKGRFDDLVHVSTLYVDNDGNGQMDLYDRYEGTDGHRRAQEAAENGKRHGWWKTYTIEDEISTTNH